MGREVRVFLGNKIQAEIFKFNKKQLLLCIDTCALLCVSVLISASREDYTEDVSTATKMILRFC